MNIKWVCNIDHYKRNYLFPRLKGVVPRIGEHVQIVEGMISFIREQKLPIRLEVVNVVYISTDTTEVHLDYRKVDKEFTPPGILY